MECYTGRKTLNLQMLQARNNISGRFTENTPSPVIRENTHIFSKRNFRNYAKIQHVIGCATKENVI